MDSIKLVKNLIKTKATPTKQNLIVGRVIIFKYKAKQKTGVYDATPFALVLSKSKSYMLGINFHWCPIKLRLSLLNYIFKKNKTNIKNNRPLEITYNDLKRILKTPAYRPIVRLYIRKRMSNQSVLIPYENLEQIAKTKSETFTGVSENKLYRVATRKK